MHYNKATLIVINSNIEYIFIKSRNDRSDLGSYQLSDPDCTSFALQMPRIPPDSQFPTFSQSSGLNYNDNNDDINHYYCQHLLIVFHVPDKILSTLHALSELKFTIIISDWVLLLSHVTGEEIKSQRNEGIFPKVTQLLISKPRIHTQADY